MNKQSVVLWIGLFATAAVWGHGDIHQRMQRLDREIAREPNNLELRLKKAEMLLIDQHAAEAYVEFSRILELAPRRNDVLLQLAKAQLLLKQYDAAKLSVDRLLQQADNDALRVRVFLLGGEVLSAAGKWLDAAQAYQKAIELSEPLEPDSVLFAANAFRQAGQVEQAIDALNNGISRLGPLQTLDEQALELEIQSRRYDAALVRVERMLVSKQRLPFLFYQKGLILDKVTRSEQAKLAYQQALDAISSMSAAKQATPSVLNLKLLIEQALQSEN